MNSGLHYVAHLVQTKNDLNRKRRRFYSLMNPKKKHYKLASDDKTFQARCEEWFKLNPGREMPHYEANFLAHLYVQKFHPSFPESYARQMYCRTQCEMKAMTREMRRARKEAGVAYVWSDHGAIHAIRMGRRYIYAEEIKQLATEWRVDKILLEG